MKSTKSLNLETFIHELNKELYALSDGWLKQAKECPHRSTEWASYASVSAILFSLSHAIGVAMDNAKKK
jgi:hypothetical protein